MKKSFIIAAIALVVGTLSMPVKAAEDVLIVNLQYVVSQSKSGVSLRKQSESLNKEVVDLIRSSDTDVIINLTTGMGGDLDIGQGKTHLNLVLLQIWLM